MPFLSYYYSLPFKPKSRKRYFWSFKFLASWPLFHVLSYEFINLAYPVHAWILWFGYVELWVDIECLSLLTVIGLFFHF
jgi:hypothetical protein